MIDREAVVQQAFDAAFPGLPPSMRPDEARRRVAAAVDVLWPLICQAREDGERAGVERGERIRGDVHHYVNPIIGMLRTDETQERNSDHRRAWIIERLRILTDAADATLGEKPMREQIADMKRDLADARGAQQPDGDA